LFVVTDWRPLIEKANVLVPVTPPLPLSARALYYHDVVSRARKVGDDADRAGRSSCNSPASSVRDRYYAHTTTTTTTTTTSRNAIPSHGNRSTQLYICFSGHTTAHLIPALYS
jgi:hypothetical protein